MSTNAIHVVASNYYWWKKRCRLKISLQTDALLYWNWMIDFHAGTGDQGQVFED